MDPSIELHLKQQAADWPAARTAIIALGATTLTGVIAWLENEDPLVLYDIFRREDEPIERMVNRLDFITLRMKTARDEDLQWEAIQRRFPTDSMRNIRERCEALPSADPPTYRPTGPQAQGPRSQYLEKLRDRAIDKILMQLEMINKLFPHGITAMSELYEDAYRSAGHDPARLTAIMRRDLWADKHSSLIRAAAGWRRWVRFRDAYNAEPINHLSKIEVWPERSSLKAWIRSMAEADESRTVPRSRLADLSTFMRKIGARDLHENKWTVDRSVWDMVRAHENRKQAAVKKAVHISMPIAAGLEQASLNPLYSHAYQTLAGAARAMVQSSSRFSDYQGTAPRDVKVIKGAIYAKPARTKTTTAMDGVAWIASAAALQEDLWLEQFITSMRKLDQLCPDRDYLLPAIKIDCLADPNAWRFIPGTIMSRSQWVAVLRIMIFNVLMDQGWTRLQALEESKLYTAHSAKSSMITAMTHYGTHRDMVIKQGGWKHRREAGSMQDEYARDSMYLLKSEQDMVINAIKEGTLDLSSILADGDLEQHGLRGTDREARMHSHRSAMAKLAAHAPGINDEIGDALQHPTIINPKLLHVRSQVLDQQARVTTYCRIQGDLVKNSTDSAGRGDAHIEQNAWEAPNRSPEADGRIGEEWEDLSDGDSATEDDIEDVESYGSIWAAADHHWTPAITILSDEQALDRGMTQTNRGIFLPHKDQFLHIKDYALVLPEKAQDPLVPPIHRWGARIQDFDANLVGDEHHINLDVTDVGRELLDEKREGPLHKRQKIFAYPTICASQKRLHVKKSGSKFVCGLKYRALTYTPIELIGEKPWRDFKGKMMYADSNKGIGICLNCVHHKPKATYAAMRLAYKSRLARYQSATLLTIGQVVGHQPDT